MSKIIPDFTLSVRLNKFTGNIPSTHLNDANGNEKTTLCGVLLEDEYKNGPLYPKDGGIVPVWICSFFYEGSNR